MKIPTNGPVVLGREFISLVPEFAAAILRTVESGWARASSLPEHHAGAGEVVITECLRDSMRLALKLDDLPWGKEMIVLPGTESRSRVELLEPDGRTDIPVLLIGTFQQQDEHDPHAIIECKRITGIDTDLCREYVIEGMDRFKTGKYGSNHAVGFMTGYLLSNNAKAAVDGVNSYLNGRLRKTEVLTPSKLISENWVWDSDHQRAAPSSPITLHHAFLELQSAPA